MSKNDIGLLRTDPMLNKVVHRVKENVSADPGVVAAVEGKMDKSVSIPLRQVGGRNG